jgi:hypothetical protein
MPSRPFQATLLEWIFIISLCSIIIFIPNLIFPALVLSFLYFLSKVMKRKRFLGVSLFRTFYALLGIIMFPLLHFGPQSYVAGQLSSIVGEEGSYTLFLTIYQIFFTVIFPILAYLSAYLLTILDVGGCIVPVIFLSVAIFLMIVASAIAPPLYSPLVFVFLLVFVGHILYFQQPHIQREFQFSRQNLWIDIFHYIYGLLGFACLYFYWSSYVENMQFVEAQGYFIYEIQHLIFGVLFAILCLLSSSLLFRRHSWGYIIPVIILPVAIILRETFLYLPLFIAHIFFFNLPNIRQEFRKSLQEKLATSVTR